MRSNAMGKPIAPALGIAYSFPDVCETILPFVGKIPFPFPNIAQLDQADKVSDDSGKELVVGPAMFHVLLEGAKIADSSGDEAGFIGGIITGDTKGECELTQASTSVKYGSEGKGLVRFMDATLQNIKDSQPNATGNVMSAFPTVLVGG
jgi:hypothetical protein